ncbi:hypothetical protein J2W22_003778 [Sphingomonas kyeonggiensis]|uniref:hypothetical protein n=1 Tax=Sphingomonas kyeonggiensis TaxID=1268553 RepID=UPI00278620AA|nr:hypothetical protein [Sphingomonas kyeonggiensis]MDQ0251690.1 hypothetical protein [Sphingomonas kyeonggiensis]
MANIVMRAALTGVALLGSGFLFAGQAQAQATRTWVSGVGDDVNPCSRTAPCKTFAGAISKTAAGGEINCIDPGGFGTVTITKSITIDCTGTFGSTLNSATNGFIVNDSATGTPGTIKVILRGLSVDGAGTTQGLNGIRFISGASLIVDNVIVQNNGNGYGVSFQPSRPAKLFLTNVTITGNGNGTSGGGIFVNPTGALGTGRVVLNDVRIFNNGGSGLQVDTVGNTATGGSIVLVKNSVISSNPIGVLVNTPAGTTTAAVMIDSTGIFDNSNRGILAGGATATVRVRNSTITGNNAGLQSGTGAVIRSYGNNALDGNSVDGAFTAPVLPQQ